jgi:uncharacterized membrane protein
MGPDLIALPIRLGASATGLASRLAERAVRIGVSATERLIELALTRTAGAAATPHAPEAAVANPAPATASTPVAPASPVAPSPPVPPEPEPAHVSREARFVEAFADPGAEEGPGAAVRIEEPWTGYGRMTAREVIARLGRASAEELAAAALYERAHRGRRTVLVEADRQLRRATAEARRPT